MTLAVTQLTAAYFVSGATALACLAAALFFVRFWRASRDRLFVIRALVFTVLGVSQLALLFARGSDAETWIYVLRLVAFLLIVVAIVEKNRGPAR